MVNGHNDTIFWCMHIDYYTIFGIGLLINHCWLVSGHLDNYYIPFVVSDNTSIPGHLDQDGASLAPLLHQDRLEVHFTI